MVRVKQTGIYQESDGTWQVDCQYRNRRIRKRGFTDHRQARDYLTREQFSIQQFSDNPAARPDVTFERAATRYLEEKEAKNMPSAETDAYLLLPVVQRLGSLTLQDICDETLAGFIRERKRQGIKNKTLNNTLSIVGRILRLAATQWRFPENRLTWLESAPKITMLDLSDQRAPQPITWAEQKLLMQHLPTHLVDMAMFCLNSGARKNVVCQLRWRWEVQVPLSEQTTVSVFVVPREYVKGRKSERLLFCNSLGQQIIDAQRGRHPERVFTWSRRVSNKLGSKPKYLPISDMHNTAWQNARASAGLGDLHVHDLRHTVGMRLRNAGVSERTQDEILWHSKRDMTSHYAVAQIREVYAALELIKEEGCVGETINLLAILRRSQIEVVGGKVPQKSPTQRKTA
jgi:integrase